ncbi:MAG: hypothetical protein ABSD41_04540 [Candidatus Bathyarchaeia archaeon]
MHDVESEIREGTIEALVRVLKDDGGIFVREPLNQITAREIRNLMQNNGLKETGCRIMKSFLTGVMYVGKFSKRADDWRDSNCEISALISPNPISIGVKSGTIWYNP